MVIFKYSVNDLNIHRCSKIPVYMVFLWFFFQVGLLTSQIADKERFITGMKQQFIQIQADLQVQLVRTAVRKIVTHV